MNLSSRASPFVLIFFALKGWCSPLPLGSFTVDGQAITASGVSAGAQMAMQLDIAFSQTFSGAGSIAGGIYWCAEGDSTRAETICTSQPFSIDPSLQIAETQRLAAQGAIDPTTALARHRFYIYASAGDTLVNMENSRKLEEYLDHFVAPAQVQTQYSIYSAHGFPTLNAGGFCDVPATPWILNCGFDAAGNILHAMYGALVAPGKYKSANLHKFSQGEFGTAADGFYPYGWVYIPTACAAGATCKLHVALHGCGMNPDAVQDQFVTEAGYNSWAESNNIIVLYPQAASDPQSNPFACWDWFGLTGKDYANQNGVQMSALKKMVDHIRGL